MTGRTGIQLNRARILLALFISAAVTGCASFPSDAVLYGEHASPVEITETPFFPQQLYQCGPAALLTVLAHSGVQTTMDAVVNQVYLPGRKGSLQVELLAATRASGRLPYVLEPELRAIVEEIEAGRPVLVLQNLGVSWAPRWHYAVIVGIDPDNGTVVLRSGTDRRRTTKTKTFIRTWRRGDNWAFVALRPGELPGRPNASRYFTSVAGLEETGHAAAARTGWQTAYQQWPDEPVAIFGIANAELAAGHPAIAENYYRELLALQPDSHFARNNLAIALSQQEKFDEALLQIDNVLQTIDADDPLRGEYVGTQEEIQKAAATNK